MVGLGTWQTFDVDLDGSEGRDVREVLRLFVERDGRVVDSSPMYGRSEAVTGTLARELGVADRLWYATKVWTEGAGAGVAQMERSFELLGVDTMDLMQVHNLVDWRTHLATLRRWKEEGRVRYVGVTHYRTDAYDRLASVLAGEPLDFVQLNYNMAVREAEERLLPLAADRGVAVLVNRPYRGGSLFRRVRGTEPPAWARERGMDSWGRFFLKYLLGHPAVTCVIPATSDPDHLVDNVGAGFGDLPDEPLRRRMVRHLEGR